VNQAFHSVLETGFGNGLCSIDVRPTMPLIVHVVVAKRAGQMNHRAHIAGGLIQNLSIPDLTDERF